MQWPAGGPKQLWKLNVGTGCASVAVNQGRVFILGNKDNADTVVCLDFNTGAVKWQEKSLGIGSLMPADGKLIIQGERGDLAVAGPPPRELARAKVLTGRCWVVPVLANGRIYCRNNLGDLACVDVSGKYSWEGRHSGRQ